MARMSKRQAEALWASLHEAFSNVEQRIVEVIETKAWLPLGYGTFAEAWNDRMAGFRLTTSALRAHVVYALLSEGQSDEEIVNNLLGVGDSFVAEQRERHRLGLPPTVTRVRSYDRTATKGPAATARVPLTPDELARFKDIADRKGLNFEAANAGALRDFWRRMESARAQVA